MTPTLALALGIPIPYSNLGIAILDIFGNEKLDAIKPKTISIFFMVVWFVWEAEFSKYLEQLKRFLPSVLW